MAAAPPHATYVRDTYRRWASYLWVLFFVALAAVAMVFVVLSFTDLPTLTQLENPKSELASEVYAADGTELGRYYTQNRVAVRYPELNPYLIDALLATEDERYYDHAGIDWHGVARAVAAMGKDGGASTITQQLAKQMFTGVASESFTQRVIQKLKEWIIATRLERAYTKEEIIAMYLNIFEYNNGAFGVEAAAEVYFGKTQADLTREEAAMLVGMLKSPTRYNPARNPELARRRREVVLKQMARAGRITDAEYDSLRATPLAVVMNKVTHVDGLAPYFRMELRKEIHRILDDPNIRQADGSPYDVNRDGLRIYTTIDPDMQTIAERVAFEHMRTVQAKYREVWRDKDPWTYRYNVGTEDETTQAELDYRARRLQQHVHDSDRYLALRQRILGPVLEDVAAAYDDWEVSDLDLDRMIAEDDDGGVFERLRASNSIGETVEGRYRALIGDRESWARVRAARRELDAEAKRAFSTKTAMKVFAYNARGEVDTSMTPLDSIRYMRSFLQIGSMAVDPHTGYVKAWVGGVNHKWFPFDHVQTRRQVGSTFKPFVYATAISQQGISPCYRVADVPIRIRVGESAFTLIEDWAPQNADRRYSGRYLSLMEALRKSTNTVSVYLMKQLGSTELVRGLIHNMGIDSSERYRNGRPIVPNSPSIALGATDLSVEEMTGAYTTWANNGVYVKPVIVRRIEDANGKVLYQAMPEERTALDPISNYSMVRLLQYAGKHQTIEGISTEYGGKTGTTNDFVDGWYMGVTPNLVVGTWVGGDERHIRFLNINYGQGSYLARPFFAKFIKAVDDDAEALGFERDAKFPLPEGAESLEFNCANVPRGQFNEEEFGVEGINFGGDPFGNNPLGTGGSADPFDNSVDPFGDGGDPFRDEIKPTRDSIEQ